jgi:succinate dehydrogenase/fumarate reductase flavoprotein subunit
VIEGYRWSDDNSVELARGWFYEASSIGALAEKIDVDPTVLQETVGRYNHDCGAGHDSLYGRDPNTMTALVKPPYYAFTWGPMVVFTCGGPRKDGRARVIDLDGSPIPRLYCAGEVSSTYSWGTAGGLMIGDALAFGRIAGRHAAAVHLD